ncbi:hypothetical protein GOBAR_AA20339 [Gossypium barbadense]|uniref:Uncharacterized protein n=1 Tax=Gossypium barbadense TaxID=3634 RepID=A0A2P5XAH1_GOSBA|nr:hypothetical protein GOBAR_AA20339 [Gossypium barbadense]
MQNFEEMLSKFISVSETHFQNIETEPSQTKTIATASYYHKKNKDVYEERRLRIEELDEWREHKPRTHDKPKLHQNNPDTFPNQLKVGDKVLLDIVDLHIVTTTPNEEIPLMVLSIFPFGTMEVSHPKFVTFKHTRPETRVCLKPWPNRGRDTIVRDDHVEARHDFPKTQSVINPHSRARRLRSHPQREVGDWVLHRYELQRKFSTHSLNFHKLRTRSYFKYYAHDPSPQALAPLSSTYNPSRSKALALPSSLRYLHAILAHTLIGRRESIGIVNTHDAYYLWCMANAHGIMTMLHMRMIERRRGTDPPQYRLSHAIDEEDLEDIPDDVCPQHEEPFTAPPREQPVHAAASFAHLSD